MNILTTLKEFPSGNAKFNELGKQFYEWYTLGKIKFISNEDPQVLDSQIRHIDELIKYVKAKQAGQSDPKVSVST